MKFQKSKPILTDAVKRAFTLVSYSAARATRLTALILTAALLLPFFTFGRIDRASAKSVSSSVAVPAAALPAVTAPLAPPPAAFEFNSPTSGAGSVSLTGAALSTVSTVSAAVTGAASQVGGFFTAPPVPEGLGAARSVSPASAMLSSFGGALLGLFISSPKNEKAIKKENASADQKPSANDPESNSPDLNGSKASALMMSPAPLGSVAFDFDGDGKADVSRRKSSTSEWKIKQSGSGGTVSTAIVGTSAGKAAPADFDGDGKTDPAVFNASTGVWTGVLSSTGATVNVTFGTAGDIPVPADYDGDGHADLAIFRPSTNVWWISPSSTGVVTTTSFGAAGDIPVPGNYDGDSKEDIAVYRPSSGAWYILGSASGFSAISWGIASDIPVQADYDGDGKTDAAVYRGSTGSWYILKSSGGGSYWAFNWGNYGDQPAPADYDGDGKADLAAFRPTTGVWNIQKSCSFTSSCAANASPYDYQTLGTAGDTAIPSAYLKQIGGAVSGDVINPARLSPKNAIGGTDLYSQNFSWGTSLVGLPGRAGMNMSFGIGYNSLVWTKFTDNSTSPATPTVVFDTDQSSVTPGFRFGFPTIEPVYWDSQTSTFNYLMVSPSGARTQFKQLAGASDTYETQDSSYLQLKTTGAANANDPVENITISVKGTDGTEMAYLYKGGAFRCSRITDRNGNYISIVHDEQGLLRTVTDTLGRTVTVYYDSQLYPTSIAQDWKDNNGQGATQTHTYAVFGYELQSSAANSPAPLINTAFAANNIAVIGPQNGTAFRVLRSVAFDSGASTFFSYNSYGQVYKIDNLAADNHVLNWVKTDLESPSASLTANGTDCPRFTQTSSWVENFNGGQTVVVRNENTLQSSPYTIGGINVQNTTRIKVSMDNEPNGHYSYTYVGAAGWQEGLPFATEDIANGAGGGSERKRWTNSFWTQDDTTKSYLVNPRQIEMRVGDTTNIKRTTIDYLMQPNSTTVSYFGLPGEQKVYDADQTTVLKRMVSEYNLGSAYLSRRIIGLPAKSELYDQSGTLMSKMTYGYDGEDFTLETNQNVSPIRHDNTNFGASFVTGRANRTSMTRWDASDSSNAGQSVTSKIRYDVAGSIVAKLAPGAAANSTRKISIDYADVFNDTSTSRNTFAYPTTLTDPAGSSSYVVYRYDLGANVRAQSPAPAGSSAGKLSTREFDAVGRISKESILTDPTHVYSYKRYEYPASGVQSKGYATITDINGNGIADAADETLSEAWSDGAGRVLRSRSIHPDSIGGFSGQFAEYDILGQVKRQSVPTEIDYNWTLAGDGATRGVLWNQQQFDWKGRSTVSTATDGTVTSASYDGCGCAGGAVITVEGEQLADGKRKQRIYTDVLGRQYKTETLNFDGTVYSSVVTKFNGRDQAQWVKQYAGAAPANALDDDSCPVAPTGQPESCQITTMTYDGHGRLKTQHAPQQDAAAATVYDYYQSDEVQKVTDARGAATAYTYNNRGLVTNVNSTMPSAAAMQAAQTAASLRECELSGDCGDPGGDPGTGNHAPFGNLDGVNNSNWTATGWAIDSDSPATAISVHFYLDHPAGQGSPIGIVTADKARPDVNQATGIAGDHGFEFTIPNQYLDGHQHTLYAYGIDTSGGNNPVLNGAPQVFIFSPNTVLPSLNTSVGISYDNLGNRVSMSDNLGRTNYEYDQFSRMTGETRSFTDTAQNGSPLVMGDAPLANNSFKLQYSYGLGNQLTALTDPYGMTISYGYDQGGRLNKVDGTSFGGVTNYAQNAKYEAWGALKQLDYGSTLQMGMTYNSRLQAESYNLTGGSNGSVMNKHYNYYADGKLSYEQDLVDPKFDRLNIYDDTGRIKYGKSGGEARGETVDPNYQSAYLPYRQSYQFNAFDNMTERNNHHWGMDDWQGQSNNLSYTYRNNRIADPGWNYDADGRNLQTAFPEDYTTAVYDARGQMARSQSEQTDALRYYDGDGREIKRQTANYGRHLNNNYSWTLQPIKYYIRSSVLGGQTVSEVWANGKKGKTFITAAGSQIAYQSAYASDTAQLYEAVFFQYSDASGMSRRTTDKLGHSVADGINGEGTAVENDPMGNNVGITTPYVEQSEGNSGYEPSPLLPILHGYFDDEPTYVNGQRQTCTADGFAISCSRAMDMLANGSAINAPASNVVGIWSNSQNRYVGLAVWNQQAAQNGIAFLGANSLGFLPVGVSYNQGVGLSGTNVTNWFPALGTSNPSNFISETSARLYSIIQGIALGGANLESLPQAQHYAPLPDTVELRAKIVERLDANDGKCRKFLDSVRQNLKIKSSIEDLFDKVIKEGGKFVSAPDLSVAGISNYGKGGKDIGLQPKTNAEVYINSAIHELIHRAGIDGHKAFAQAGFEALSDDDRKTSKLPTKKSPGLDMDDTFSQYFSKLMNTYCRPSE